MFVTPQEHVTQSNDHWNPKEVKSKQQARGTGQGEGGQARKEQMLPSSTSF